MAKKPELWPLEELIKAFKDMEESAAYKVSRPSKNPQIRRKDAHAHELMCSSLHYLNELQTLKQKA